MVAVLLRGVRTSSIGVHGKGMAEISAALKYFKSCKRSVLY